MGEYAEHEGAGDRIGLAWGNAPYPGDGFRPTPTPVPPSWPAPVGPPAPAWPVSAATWPSPPPAPAAAWPVWSTVPAEPPPPTLRRAPDPLTVEAITGRAHRAPGFWVHAGALAALLLFPSGMLLVWAVWFGGTDHERSAQVTWSVILAVTTLGLLARLSLTGTAADRLGVRRTTLFGSERILWSTVTGFSGGSDGRPGIWLHTSTSPTPRQIPSSMHATPPSEATATAEWLNAAGDLPSVPPRRTRSGKIGNCGRSWLRWTWWLPLVTVGLATPVVLAVGAIISRRRWLWLAWAVSIDLFAIFMAAGQSPSPAAVAVGMTAFLALWLGAPLVLLVVGLRAGRPGPATAPMAVDRAWP